MARQSSALSALLVVYREDEKVVISGKKDYLEGDREGGNSFIILRLVKGNFNFLLHN